MRVAWNPDSEKYGSDYTPLGEGGGHLFNSSLPLLLASQTLRH